MNIAEHPPASKGNFNDLCIDQHLFEGENFAWMFTKAQIKDTDFENCKFTNQQYSPNNFTGARWTDVKFKGCFFGSDDANERMMVFDKTVMKNVEFRDCEFHHSVDLLFSEFNMNNISFVNCSFTGNTVFQKGEIEVGRITNSNAMRSQSAKEKSGNDSFTFLEVTAFDVITIGSTFLSPIRLHSVNAGNFQFNESVINEFHCHSEPDEEGVELMTSFNNSLLQDIIFEDKVVCDRTSWNGFYMGNITFNADASFASSKIEDITWDWIHSKNDSSGDCTTLDFSGSILDRRLIANLTVDCKANFERSSIETVKFKNVTMRVPLFKDAVFTRQEYIDGQCCTNVCRALECLCNVTELSGNCPKADPSVNATFEESTCFPGDATVRSIDGKVMTMEELALGERVAIGRGEHSDVYFFGHRSANHMSKFVSILHEKSTRPLRLSAAHYLYVNGELRTAGTVRSGDRLHSESGKDDIQVVTVTEEQARGLYAPTSLHGDLLVDDVVVSSYTSAIHPVLAHRLLHPLRLMYRYGLDGLVSRLSLFEGRSWEPIARRLGLRRGPDVVL